MINKKSKIYVTGHNGLVGSSILRRLKFFGYKNIIRPNEFATPSALHHDVLIHALQEMKKNEHIPDILVVLMANSPTIKSEWLNDCIQLILKEGSITSVVPVVMDQDKHPYRFSIASL